MIHSPLCRPEDERASPSHSQRDLQPPCTASNDDFRTPTRDVGHAAAADSRATVVDAVSSCKLPPFWRTKPGLWFKQVDAILQLGRVRSDQVKFNNVISALDAETLADVEDVIDAPPSAGKYVAIREAILSRLTESADRQMLKLFTQLELGDQRPSQLLRHMRSLAANRVPDDVLRVKWLDLLPVSVQRLLRILKTASLEELAAFADELVDTSSSVSSPRHVYATHSTSPSVTSTCRPAAESASFRDALAQITLKLDNVLNRVSRMEKQQRRPGSRSKQRNRTPSSSPGRLCRYHRRWGTRAHKCISPCSFNSTQAQEN